MKFKFKKLGLLDDTTLELADFTLICGENNTGKTYATYAIYGFLKTAQQLFSTVIREDLEKQLIFSADTQKYSIDLEKLFVGKINHYLARMSVEYKNLLPFIFSTHIGFFANSELDIELLDENNFIDKGYSLNFLIRELGIVLSKIPKKEFLYLYAPIEKDSLHQIKFLYDLVADAIFEIVFADYFPKIHIASAERTGVAVFKDKLNIDALIHKFPLQGLSLAHQLDENFNFDIGLQSNITDYALPVYENINYMKFLGRLSKNKSWLLETYPEIIEAFEEVAGGSYQVDNQLGLFFQTKNGSFALNQASSCVKALLDINFYLRCQAQKGDLLIIDEPELNLHPKNQRAFARLLARLVNVGIKVLVTTHSDYLIKELNTLIMLGQKTEHTIRMQEKYKYDEQELLKPAQIHLYTTKPQSKSKKNYTLKLAKIYADKGIEVDTFDNTIDEMNKIQDAIFFGE